VTLWVSYPIICPSFPIILIFREGGARGHEPPAPSGHATVQKCLTFCSSFIINRLMLTYASYGWLVCEPGQSSVLIFTCEVTTAKCHQTLESGDVLNGWFDKESKYYVKNQSIVGSTIYINRHKENITCWTCLLFVHVTEVRIYSYFLISEDISYLLWSSPTRPTNECHTQKKKTFMGQKAAK